MREYRLVPTHRLLARLRLTDWEHQICPLDEADYRPQRVSIPLRQHIGAAAQPIVSVGDRVAVGDRIAQIPGEALGANMHASLAGTISRIDGAAIEILA
jgi:Na+-translocating ferredoxin:NAD+ oxidoreductase RnfC subunit